MGFNSSTPSWQTLGQLRRRGQRPEGMVFVTDHWLARRTLEDMGWFALPLPIASDAVFVAGLDVVLIAEPGDAGAGAAQLLAGANPRSFVTRFRGRPAERVL